MSKRRRNPRELAITGLVLIAAAVAAYFYIGHAEQQGGSIVLPVLLMPVYKVLGKMGIVAVLLALGLITSVRGALKMRLAAQVDKAQAAREARQAREAQAAQEGRQFQA
jgi:hypothetical protein